MAPPPSISGPNSFSIFEFLWFVETYVKEYVLKLLLADVHIKTVRNSAEDVKFIFTRLTSSVDVVE